MALTGPARTVAQTVSLVVVMGGLAWASVPFYDWFCRFTGFGGLLDTHEAAAVFGDRHARTLDLTGSGFVAQLRHQFEDLRQAGGADRMSPGLEAAGRVDRNASAEARGARLDQRTALTDGAELQVLGLQDFCKRRRIVYFGDVDITGPDPGPRVGLLRSQATHMLIVVGDRPCTTGGDDTGAQAHRARARKPPQRPATAQHGGGGAVTCVAPGTDTSGETADVSVTTNGVDFGPPLSVYKIASFVATKKRRRRFYLINNAIVWNERKNISM